jgi:alkylation response protein AidB-like acyl-CoA dehydrogenase
MDLTPTPSEAEFRERLRSWLEANTPVPYGGPHEADDPGHIEYLLSWQRKLGAGGWLGITWPEEHGGLGLSPIEQLIFLEEMARAGAPEIIGLIATGIVGPTIAALGTDDQKRRHLPPILRGEEVWAQGFSEPNAGSDLGSLTTRAVRDGGYFVVNGQKTWTSWGHVSDWMLMLVRTDPEAPKFKGITCLLVDMRSDGVSVRPLKMMSGDAGFNEVFFSDVRVPVENVLGEIGGGWNATITALMFERNLTGELLSQLTVGFNRVLQAVEMRGSGDDPLIRQRVAQTHLDLEVFRLTTARAASRLSRGGAPGPESAILKLFWSELSQRIARLAVDVLGTYGQLTEGDSAASCYDYLRCRGRSIEGGTSEVLKNTMATRVLGLPKSF